MSEINVEARDRYYAEVSLNLSKAGFAPQTQEDGYLPVDWNGSRLCRLTANGGVQYEDGNRIRDIQEQIERLVPGTQERAEALEAQAQAQQLQAQTMY